MVRRTDLHSAHGLAADRDSAEAVGATTVSGSAAAVDLAVAYLPLDRLRPSPRNARKHSKKQLKQIAKSITRFGFVNPVLISDDFEIIAGHGRVEAAKMLGLCQVPTVRLSNLSAVERRAYMIADNRLAQLAGWNREILTTELSGLLDLQFDDLEATGFSLDRIELMLEETAPTQNAVVDDDECQADLTEAVVSRTGDVWILGQHRLVCGEASRDCDAAVRGWQQYSGKPAQLEGSGMSFADVAAARGSGNQASLVAAQRSA